MRESKKTAIYCNTWDADGGGGIVYVLAIAKILTTNGFDTTVFFNDSILLSELHARYETSGLKIKTQKRSHIPLLSQVHFAIKEWFNFDIVIQQSLVGPRLTFVKESYILCDFPMGKRETISEKIRFRFWKNTIVNSDYTKQWVQNYWKRDALVLYPLIDIPTEFNCNRNIDIVCIGRFNNGRRSKRQDVVISVFKDLIQLGYEGVRLHLVGYVQDENYVNNLKDSVFGFPVLFHENCLAKDRITLLNNSAVFISACGFENNEKLEPMLVEHFGISVIEAMSYGAIPLVIGKGGHLETVDNRINGYHWSTKEELKEILILLFENRQLRETMSKEAYSKSMEYSSKKLEEKVLKVFVKPKI
ncbi:glycosyltransferase family 4 protein [Flavobacterium sp. PL12]|uniref:glycosyltransferase family 4 protein n=1 Tax=Flavobacterium sp. PL12 TaxID=3071718 RepID=UPI00319DF9F6